VSLYLGVVMVAFGATLSLGERKTPWLLPLACATCGLTSLILNPWQLPLGLVACVVAGALAVAVRSGRAGTGFACALALGSALALLACDAGVALSTGATSIAEVFEQSARELEQAARGSQNLGMRDQLEVSLQMMRQYWPMTYLVAGLLQMVCAYAGTRVASAAAQRVEPRPRLADYDVPIWVAVLYLASALVSLAATYVPGVPEVVSFVGANALAAARVALMIQGAAVAAWFLDEHDVGGLAKAVVVLLAAWLEVSLVVTSVVGLVDVVVNLRGIRRTGFRDKGSANTTEESA
jgi:hypothetical protein